jgi:hypothetical protein
LVFYGWGVTVGMANLPKELITAVMPASMVDERFMTYT